MTIVEKLRALADEAENELEGAMPAEARSLFGTITLGGLIDLLTNRDNSERIQFDFCGYGPASIHSYRGYYDHLAIGRRELTWNDGEDMIVGEFIALLRGAIGKKFTGWKGGEYTMRLDTPVWIDEPDSSSGTGIVGVTAGSISYFLTTRHFD